MAYTYPQINCPCCNQLISRNGLAKTSHFRKHVKDGLMTERTLRGETVFDLTADGLKVRQQALEAEKAAQEQAIKDNHVNERVRQPGADVRAISR